MCDNNTIAYNLFEVNLQFGILVAACFRTESLFHVIAPVLSAIFTGTFRIEHAFKQQK